MEVKKVEIVIEFSAGIEVEDGEDIQEQRFVFIKPEKIRRLVKEPYILSEVIQEIQNK